MNLHGLAGPLVGVVNPPVLGTVRVSSGYTTAADGKRSPSYTDIPGVPMQVQSLTGPELKQTEGLNIAGVKRGVYLSGNFETLSRKRSKGGDLLVFGGSTWLIVAVLETWPDWCKVAVTEQVDQ